MGNKWLFASSLYGKLSLGLLISFILIGLLLLVLAQHLTKRYQNEVEQKMHKDLAYQVIKDNNLLKDGDIDKVALKNAFRSMMILGPGFEFYLLDAEGYIKTYSADPDRIKRQLVDLEPIESFVQGDEALPIFGDDPRSPNKQKIFTVSPIYDGTTVKGYLYIIIGGEIYDDISQLIKSSHNIALAAWSLFLALLFGLVAILLLFASLTRPLRLLTQDMQTFRQQGFQLGTLPPSQWCDQSEDEIQRLGCAFYEMAKELNCQYQKIKNTDELRRELISYASHDLRTPLASLQGYLETWQLKHAGQDTEDSKALIKVAMKNAQQMNRLIEQLFELAYLDANDIKLSMEPLAIAELAQDVLLKFGLAADKKEIKLDLIANDPGVLVNGNIEKLERVLNNLIDNAIRHCKAGDAVQVIIESAEDLSDDSSGIQVKIRDTGIGIKQDEQSRIFENHYRASNSVAGKGPNSGLGLAISARVVNLHGSQLNVSSELGQGSEFFFTLTKAA